MTVAMMNVGRFASTVTNSGQARAASRPATPTPASVTSTTNRIGSAANNGEAWRKMINDLYGSEDEISIVYFETPVVADNLVQQTIEDVEPVAPVSVA